MQTNTAYDLTLFEQRPHKPQLHVVETGGSGSKGKILAGIRWVRIVAFAAVFLALVVSVLYSQAQSTALSAQVRRQQNTLEDLQSEYTYLSNQMEMRTSLAAVQEYAANVLKMVKLDRSQITYVTAEEENSVERSENGLARMAGDLSHTIGSFVEYLAP